MLSKDKTTEDIKNALASEEGIIFAYLHGFFLHDFPFRDIDLALYVDPAKIPPAQSFDFAFRLSVLLTKQTELEVDARVMNEAPPGFFHSVFRNGKLLFSRDEDLRSSLIEKASLEYLDFYELNLQYIRDMAG